MPHVNIQSQIPLQLGRFQQSDFSTFLAGRNQVAVELIKKIATNETNHFLYIWGDTATGKSHLLQSACKYAAESNQRVAYIPLERVTELHSDILHDLGDLNLVCVDDVDFLCGKNEWQKALVWLYNELRDRKNSLLLSASVAPLNVAIELEDLRSRLVSDQVCQLFAPNDALKREILKRRAEAHSFELSDEVIDYLMARVHRDLCSLMQIFDEIDHTSLVKKRKITIPFIREIIR